jgi:hypothetical protein
LKRLDSAKEIQGFLLIFFCRALQDSAPIWLNLGFPWAGPFAGRASGQSSIHAGIAFTRAKRDNSRRRPRTSAAMGGNDDERLP